MEEIIIDAKHRKLTAHMTFFDLEDAFGSIPNSLIEETLLAPVEGFGRGCSYPSGKKRIFMLFMPILVICLCSEVSLENLENISPPKKKYVKKSQK